MNVNDNIERNVFIALDEKNFKHINSFDEKHKKVLLKLFKKDFLSISSLQPYMKIVQQELTFMTLDGEEVYNTLLTLVGCIIVEKDGFVADGFIVPANPFRIRSEYELSTLEKLMEGLQDEIVAIRDEFGEGEPNLSVIDTEDVEDEESEGECCEA